MDERAETVLRLCHEPCREWVTTKNNRCNERSDVILWGKFFPPEALGPRCMDHAAAYIEWRNLSLDQITQYAIFDLRPIRDAITGEREPTVTNTGYADDA
jgi:hypothetical protein